MLDCLSVSSKVLDPGDPEYPMMRGSKSKVRFETEVSQHRSGQSIPLGNVCSGYV